MHKRIGNNYIIVKEYYNVCMEGGWHKPQFTELGSM